MRCGIHEGVVNVVAGGAHSDVLSERLPVPGGLVAEVAVVVDRSGARHTCGMPASDGGEVGTNRQVAGSGSVYLRDEA